MARAKSASREGGVRIPLLGALRAHLLTWNKQTQLSAVFWATAVAVAILLVPAQPYQGGDYKVGDIAQRDIRAGKDYLVEDPASTQARRLEAEAAVPAVYDMDSPRESGPLAELGNLFSGMRDANAAIDEERADIAGRAAQESPDAAVARRELARFDREAASRRAEALSRLLDASGLELSGRDMAPLVKDGFSKRVERLLAGALEPAVGAAIVNNREGLLRERGRGVTVRNHRGSAEEVVLEDFDGVLSLDTARALVRKGLSEAGWERGDTQLRRAAEGLALGLVRPNLTYNRSETEARRRQAAEQTRPVYYHVRKGEIIVRAGDPVTAEHLLKIQSMRPGTRVLTPATLALGTFLLVALILYAFHRVLRVVNPRMSVDTRSLTMLAMILLLQVALTRGSLVLSEAMVMTSFGFDETAMNLAVPYASAALIVGAFFPTLVGLVVAFLAAVFSAALAGWDQFVFIYAAVGGIAAAFAVVHCQQRSSLIRAGLTVSAANVAVAGSFILLGGELFTAASLHQIVFAALGGVGVTLVVSVALPLLESWFLVATDMKLMELANLNQPLLKEMVLHAPGTYHHSVLVGSLAEAAAEEIGANPLLARAGALYHDLGKVNKPEYFVENQEAQDNRHEKLSPSMSALILTAHVKDGVETARRHRLPRRVVDIVAQHHGTRLITFFFSKAKEIEDPSVHTVDERDFRYPGPKPQNREAAIIMLADAVEAASKVLADPTPARIRGLVQKTINDIFVDGQLDESYLTLRDLHLIARSFTRTITGILHHRIDYPYTAPLAEEKRERRRRKGDDSVDEQDSGDVVAPEEAPRSGVSNIRRLGQG